MLGNHGNVSRHEGLALGQHDVEPFCRHPLAVVPGVGACARMTHDIGAHYLVDALDLIEARSERPDAVDVRAFAIFRNRQINLRRNEIDHVTPRHIVELPTASFLVVQVKLRKQCDMPFGADWTCFDKVESFS
jgi:hypothetical protein